MTQGLAPHALARHPIGVLGGMGPLATVDFLHKLVSETGAEADQDHLALIVRFCPEVPDRGRALFGTGPSPEPALVAAALGLQAAGARCLVMPCNTAHAWYDAIASALAIPVLHIVDCALSEAAELRSGAPMGLLATRGTRHGALYPRRAGAAAQWVEPDDDEQAKWVETGIAAVKRGCIDEAGALLGEAARRLVRRGAGVVLMGCTEVPLALQGQVLGAPTVDSSAALARACVRWARQQVQDDPGD